MIRRVTCWMTVALLAATPVRAACTAPVPPDPTTRPAKLPLPVKPACADAKPGAEGCMGWESYSYNDAVKAYNAQVPAFKAKADAYVAKLNAYVNEAAAYARCEVGALQER